MAAHAATGITEDELREWETKGAVRYKIAAGIAGDPRKEGPPR
jgi:hypothetical protein